MSEDQERIEAALRQRTGMDPEARENLKAFNEAQKDWYAMCRTCHKTRTGTLAELRLPCTHEVCDGTPS